jgi:hypothetical protein
MYMHGGVNPADVLICKRFLTCIAGQLAGNLRAAMSVHFVIDAVQFTLI